MNNEELKKKIVEILKVAMEPIEYGGDSEHTPEIVYPTEEEIADTLILNGIGDVKKFAETIASKIPCHSYYYGNDIVSAIYVLAQGKAVKEVKPADVSEFRLQQAVRRAEVAERALYNLSKEFVDMQGYEKWDIPILAKEIVVPDYIKQAEKEFAEEKNG